ncbi:unnamed protein product, partial [Menidia menidia]
FEKTVVHYEEEIDRQRRLLEITLSPRVQLHRIVLSISIKEPTQARNLICALYVGKVFLKKVPSLSIKEPTQVRNLICALYVGKVFLQKIISMSIKEPTQRLKVRLRLLPRARCLFDQPVKVKLAGLRPRQVVTLRARSHQDMSSQHMRDFICQRLTAAAEEIFSEFEKTVVHYEEEID